MAQSYQTTDGKLIRPGAYAKFEVKSGSGGTSTQGVVVLFGEADAGPDYSLESDLTTGFGPDQDSAVIAKYKSGNLVDGFMACANPSNDPEIKGAPTKIILVKTNVSTKASALLKKFDTTTYATLRDASYGKLGNLIYGSVVADTAEVIPTTGSFSFIPPVGTVNATLRANGAAGLSVSLSANATPATFVSTVDGLSGVAASGGAARTTIQASTGTLALAVVSGNTVLVTYSGTFTTTPSVGDTMVIPLGSVIKAESPDISTLLDNVGAYVVTAATSSTISATKLSDAARTGAVPGTITAPTAASAISVTATVANDLIVYAPVSVTLEAANPLDGTGKSLELAELTTGTDLLSRTSFQLGTSTAVTWVSKTGAAKLLSSAAEYVANLTVNRQVDNRSEELKAGGEIALKVSYLGTTATLTVSDSTLSTTVVGGAGASLSAISLKDFPSIADLVAYMNAQTGYSAASGTAVLGNLPSTALDDGTYNIGSTFGAQNGRIKVDGYRFAAKVATSTLVQLAATPATGLPAPLASTFLTGGAKGGTTQAQAQAAVDRIKKLRTNFVVPLFSRDASEDVIDLLTETGSTYLIDSLNAYVRSHVNAMAKLKVQRNRQAMLSKKGTFAVVKEAAANISNFRCAMSFLDQKVVGASGIIQAQPWMDACVAAGMQAAGGYKGLTLKAKNVSGSLQAAGDWDDQDIDAVEEALVAGLLPTVRNEDGRYQFSSDQTTYGKDENPVYNSIQAVYVADLISLSTAKQMQDAFAGQSLPDVSKAVALTKLDSIMEEFMRLKWIAPSDGAPKGYLNPKITITGNAMVVEAEVKEATTLYFIPISFLISQVEQSA